VEEVREREMKNKSSKLISELFDKFIEIGGCFIRADQILAVEKMSAGGVKVYTTGKTYVDETINFDDLIEEVNNAQSSHPQKKSGAKNTLPPPPSPPPNLEMPRPGPPKKLDLSRRTARIDIEKMDAQYGTAVGVLPDAPKVIRREEIKITSSTGELLATGHQDGNGTVVGKVTGIVNESGRYRLVFKGYAGDVAYISYAIEKEE